jgi:hypothetical protein
MNAAIGVNQAKTQVFMYSSGYGMVMSVRIRLLSCLDLDLPDCDGRPLDALLEFGPARGSIT